MISDRVNCDLRSVIRFLVGQDQEATRARSLLLDAGLEAVSLRLQAVSQAGIARLDRNTGKATS